MADAAAPSELLGECGDVVVRCADFSAPGSRYVLSRASPVLRHAFALQPACDGAGRRVLDLPRGGEGLRRALGLLHGDPVGALRLAELPGVVEALDYLGAAVHLDAALDRAWDLLREAALPDLTPWLPRLLGSSADDARLFEIVRRVLVLCVGWRPFAAALDAAGAAGERVVSAVSRASCGYFPPVVVLRWALPRASSGQLALAAQHGVYYHPAEVTAAMDLVRPWLAPAEDALVATWLEGSRVFASAPRAGGLTCTVVDYHEPAISVLVDVRDAWGGRARSRRLTPWLTLRWGDARFEAAGGFDASLTLAKTRDANATSARRLDARVMAFDGDDELLYERWNTIAELDPRATALLSAGRERYFWASFEGRASRVRIDLFFGRRPVWAAPY